MLLPRDPLRRRAVRVGLALGLAASLGAIVLLRSFEFVTFPEIIPPLAAVPEAAPARSWGHHRPGERRVEGVTLVIIDGLRVDVSREMPALEGLRKRGSGAVISCDFPSFSRTGYAAILTGAGPRVHGFLSNYNRRPSPVESIAGVARASGVHTRLRHEGQSSIPAMFPDAFEVNLPLAETAAALPVPYLDIIYFSEPDDTGHLKGGASDAYRAAALEVDRRLGKIVAALDLSHQALIVTSDHGHIDRGGHIGHEPVVMSVPIVGGGPGVGVAGLLSQHEIAPLVARLLGIRAPASAGALGRRDPLEQRLIRIVIALGSLTILASILKGPGARDVIASGAGAVIFLLLYGLSGSPFSFSCVNDAGDTATFGLRTLALAAVSLLCSALLVRSGSRYAAASLLVAASAVAVTGAVAGPHAASALDHPLAAYLYLLALGYLGVAGILALPLSLLVKVHGRRAEDGGVNRQEGRP